MFLRGRVATGDGTPVPSNVLVERICDSNVRQQVYAAPRGDFTMELRSKTDAVLDASGARASEFGVTNKNPVTGIPPRELANCELRALVPGFKSEVIGLAEVMSNAVAEAIDVGAIVIERLTKVDAMTLSATPYKAPRDAQRAYQKGLQAEAHGQLAEAQQCFERAVEIYPRFTHAWFRLGTVLQREHQNDRAHQAFTRATAMDTRFLPPYLSLASMAYKAQSWREVLNLTGHILRFDPLNYAHVTGYILDLDPFDYAEAYFYDAMANYKLNKLEDAEKSALKAASLDTRPRFPRLHLLLAEIFARKNSYSSAISEIQTYLELVPHAQNADELREWSVKLQKLDRPASTKQKTDEP